MGEDNEAVRLICELYRAKEVAEAEVARVKAERDKALGLAAQAEAELGWMTAERDAAVAGLAEVEADLAEERRARLGLRLQLDTEDQQAMESMTLLREAEAREYEAMDALFEIEGLVASDIVSAARAARDKALRPSRSPSVTISDRDQPALVGSVVAESRGWILMICCRTAGQVGAVDLPPETVVYDCKVGRDEMWCATMHTRSWRAAKMWCEDTAYTLEIGYREVDDE